MSFTTLASRGLFHNDGHSHVNHTCPVPNETGPLIVPAVGNLTFQQLAKIIAGAMMGFACLLSCFLIMMHATHYSIPSEQKQIIRITFTIPIFAIVSFLSIAAERKAIYLTPLLDVYEAAALASFFLLLCNYIERSPEAREKKLDESGKLGMYNRVWFFVFQQPVVMFVVFLATEITEAAKVYCATSSKVVFAHVWLSSVELTTSMCAIVAVVRFYKGTKTMTFEQRPLLKLLTFKVIVFLWTTQNAIFNYLTSSGKIHANDHLSFLDFTVGLQSLIVCAEMVVISILFQLAYPISPYLWKHQAANPAGRRGGNTGYSGGFLGVKAILGAANISDLLKGIVAAPAKLARGRAMKRTEVESGNSVPLGERQKSSVPTFEIAPGK